MVFSAKMQILKEHKKEKKTLFVNTTVLTALVKMSVFSCIFHFCCFWNFHFFRDAFDRFPKIKKKTTKYQSNKNKETTTIESKMQRKKK